MPEAKQRKGLFVVRVGFEIKCTYTTQPAVTELQEESRFNSVENVWRAYNLLLKINFNNPHFFFDITMDEQKLLKTPSLRVQTQKSPLA